MPRHPPRSPAAAVPPPPGTARRSPCPHSTTTRRHPAIRVHPAGCGRRPVRGTRMGEGAMAARDEGMRRCQTRRQSSHDQQRIGRPGLPVRRPTRLRGCRAGASSPRSSRASIHGAAGNVVYDIDAFGFLERDGFAHGASEPLAAVVARAAARPVRGRRGHLPGAQLRPLEHHLRRGRHGRDRDRPADLDRDGGGGARPVPGAPRRAPGGRRHLHALATSTTSAASRASSRRRRSTAACR